MYSEARELTCAFSAQESARADSHGEGGIAVGTAMEKAVAAAWERSLKSVLPQWVDILGLSTLSQTSVGVQLSFHCKCASRRQQVAVRCDRAEQARRSLPEESQSAQRDQRTGISLVSDNVSDSVIAQCHST